MKHTFKVCPEGIKRTLNDTFSSSTTYFTELMQNAQRAGATRIDVTYEKETRALTIIDNGHGFNEDSWTAFFTAGESEWCDDVIASQSPFGIGCSAMLYAAKNVEISSNNQFIAFDTDEILAGAEFERIEKPTPVNQTIFKLTIKEEVSDNALTRKKDSILNLLAAFPVPVSMNGEPVPRPFALDSSLDIIKTKYATVVVDRDAVLTYLKRENRYGQSPSSFDFGLVLQGLPVKDSKFRDDSCIRAHLESNEFRAKVPDRCELIGDFSGKLDNISHAIDQHMINVIITLMEDDASIIADYWYFLNKRCTEKINNSPILRTSVGVMNELPSCESNSSLDDVMEPVTCETTINKELIAGQPLFLIEPLYEDFYPTAEYNIRNFLYHKGAMCLKEEIGGVNHWINKQVINTDNAQISIEVFGDTQETDLDKISYAFSKKTLVLCDAFKMTMTGAANFDDETVEMETDVIDNDAVCFKDKIYVTRKLNDMLPIVRQCCRPTVENGFDNNEDDEAFLNVLERQFNGAVAFLKQDAPTDILIRLLNENKDHWSLFEDTMGEAAINIQFNPEKKLFEAA